jgi:putative DNA base modification enzyme with NMAD domain
LKIVLSRKGFDASNGGVPSPILPDGRLVPLPIPAKHDPHSYDEVTINGLPLGPLVEELSARKIKRTRTCHLDPDLDEASLPRVPAWRPAFGQIDAAQTHLTQQNVGIGDLFLFFGWFRAVEEIDGRQRYVLGAPDLHVIYGWMEIGRVIRLADRTNPADSLAPFADHPHLHGRDRPSNTLYLGSDRLQLPYINRRGAGIFRHISDGRILTDTNQSKRSIWRLPAWFHPEYGTTLSYHKQLSRWAPAGSHCILTSASRGQEFVFTLPGLKTAESWLWEVFGKRDIE